MKDNTDRVFIVLVYSIAHFIVDFACAFMIYRAIFAAVGPNLHMLCYNFCAFALQAPLGIVADRFRRTFLFAIGGCAFIIAAYGVWHIPLIAAAYSVWHFPLATTAAFGLWQIPLAAVVCAGLGNALFHIGGGVDVLKISEGKAGALGIFVSPGALGIYFGTMFGSGIFALELPIVLALFITMGIILMARLSQSRATPQNATPQSAPFSPLSPFSPGGATSPRLLIVVACLIIVVCLRSYAGLLSDFPWKSVGIWGTLFVGAVALGKGLGGILSDRFGKIKTACVSLGIAVPLSLLPGVPTAGIVAVFSFNMTMPLTLWALAKIFPGAAGFSFGLLSFALFLGYLPAYSGIIPPPGAIWLFPAAAAISIPLLCAGLKKAEECTMTI